MPSLRGWRHLGDLGDVSGLDVGDGLPAAAAAKRFGLLLMRISYSLVMYM